METKFALLSIENPQYFSGYHLPVLAVTICQTITFGEMAEEIEKELTGEESEEFTNLAEKYMEELKQTPDEIFYKFDEEISEEDAEFIEDWPTAFFSLVTPQTHSFLGHSITFLS